MIQLHRPRDLNLITDETLVELSTALPMFDDDPSVHVIILTGSDRVFAAGRDIVELTGRSYHGARHHTELSTALQAMANTRKPVVAAVSGFALGAGCELALAADVVIAAQDATFGQPEIQLATLPGGGGTQRLVRAVGKAKAMELILTGRHMDAEEAESAGLVTRVAKKGEALKEARDVAKIIAKQSLPVVMAAKECVNIAFETSLAEGLRFEQRAAQATFALDDQKEGIKAFVDGRKPKFNNR